MRPSRTFASLLLSAALALAAFPAAAQSVKVHVSVAPAASKGPCPATFTFTGHVTMSKRGTFTYKWERSDGAIDTNVHPPVAFDGIHPATVSETWQLGAAGNPLFHPFHGWVKLHILTPTDTLSNAAHFTLDCGGQPVGYPGPGTNCNGKPDLVPYLPSPMDGNVGVKNIGTGPAGASILSIKCQRVGYPGPGGGCVDVPASMIAPPFFAMPGALGVRIPALTCGQASVVKMPWWANMVWPKGTYTFTATADATNLVAESNEGNNVANSTLVKP